MKATLGKEPPKNKVIARFREFKREKFKEKEIAETYDRAGLPAPVQAAQHYAREELGLLRVDDLPVVDHTRLPIADPGAERWEVTLAGPDGPVVVTVESRPSPETVHLTCQAVRPGRVRTWHLLSLSVPSSAR